MRAAKNPKKIAFVTHNMSFGGVQRVVKNLISAFVGEFDITLILFEDKTIELEVPNSVKIVTLKEQKFDYSAIKKRSKEEICSFGEELFYFRVLELEKILEKIEIELIISHEDYNNLVLMSSLQESKKEIKVILTSHLFLDSYKNGLIHLLPSEFYENNIKRFYKKAEVVAVSSGVSSGLKELGVESTVIENGVDIKQIESSGEMTSGYKNFILSIGRIEFDQKGQDDLLRAYAKIQHRVSCDLLFVGEGKDSKRLESMIEELSLKDRVKILGFTKNPYSFIKDASLLAFPSYYEGLPNTILEGLALGTPIVSYDFRPSSVQISDGGKYFPLIKQGDIEGLALEIEDILGDKNRADELKKLSKIRAQDYALEKMVERWRELICKS